MDISLYRCNDYNRHIVGIRIFNKRGSRTSMEFFMASALPISWGRKYLPLSKSSPTSLMAGSNISFNRAEASSLWKALPL